MHSLLMLYRLQMSALRRRVFRGLGSVKGAFLFVFGLVVVGLWVAPAVWSAHAGPRTDPAVVRENLTARGFHVQFPPTVEDPMQSDWGTDA